MSVHRGHGPETHTSLNTCKLECSAWFRIQTVTQDRDLFSTCAPRRSRSQGACEVMRSLPDSVSQSIVALVPFMPASLSSDGLLGRVLQGLVPVAYSARLGLAADGLAADGLAADGFFGGASARSSKSTHRPTQLRYHTIGVVGAFFGSRVLPWRSSCSCCYPPHLLATSGGHQADQGIQAASASILVIRSVCQGEVLATKRPPLALHAFCSVVVHCIFWV